MGQTPWWSHVRNLSRISWRPALGMMTQLTLSIQLLQADNSCLQEE